jgi:hypothetical protein
LYFQKNLLGHFTPKKNFLILHVGGRTNEENPKHRPGDLNQRHVSVAPLTRINRPITSVSTGSKVHRGENGKFVTLGESGAMLGSLASLLVGPSLKEKISAQI